MSITIKTRLNDGIYKSSGGGQVRTHYEWATGPRNLLRAAETFHEHSREMVRAYGNIGCGQSWLEIDGQRVDTMDLGAIQVHDKEILGAEYQFASRVQSPTDKARDLIKCVRSGEYAAAHRPAQYDVD